MFRVFDSRYTSRSQVRPILVFESGSAFGPKDDGDEGDEAMDGDIEIVERAAISPDRPLVDSQNERLWAHLASDAQASDLFVGETPETWSPLGSTDLASAGRLSADLELAKGIVRETGTDPLFPDGDMDAGVEVEFTTDGGVPLIGVRESGRGSAAAVFGAFSIIVPIPAGSSGVELENYPVAAVEVDLVVRAARLEAYVGTSRIRRLLVWRLYRGIGSSVVDGVTELRDGGMRVQYRTVEHGAYLVGRVALSAGRVRTRNDPFRRLRMAMAEREGRGPQIVRDFPRIEHAWPDELPMVVAVHGTMSTAIPMAGALTDLVPGRRIVRFEHDTWHSIVQNSDLLAQQILRLRPERISLVAHSRGGLVSRRAAELLADRGRTDVRVITLGTPFAGTELIDQARGGLLGARVALGALRVLTGGMIDPISRMASLLFQKLPPGIEEMSPDSLFRTAYAGGRDNLELFAAAGDVDEEGAAEVSGLSLSALHGLARAGYGRNGASGDLVVSVRSATTGAMPDNTRIVASDHFSYFLQEDVKQLIRSFA